MYQSFALYQNYPNPFNPTTEISYQIPTSGRVVLKVYDILGREVARLVDRMQEAGMHSVEFDGKNFSSGIYLYRLTLNGQTMIKKMEILK